MTPLRIVFLPLLAILAGNAFAGRWVPVVEGSSRAVYLDTAGAVRDGRLVRTWIREVFTVLDPETFAKDPTAVDRMETAARPLFAEPAFPLKLPKINAGLNAMSGVCLLIGLGFIKRKRIGVHKVFMLAALGISTLFLVSYLTAHKFLGSTPYQGGLRPLYLSILLSHTVLAALIVPLAGITLYKAFSGQIETGDDHMRFFLHQSKAPGGDR